MALESTKLSEFPLQDYEDLYNPDRAKRKNDKKKELKNFFLDWVVSKSDGSCYLVAEEFYYTGSIAPSVLTNGNDQTHFDDIIVVKIDPSGDLEWARSIFKRDTEPSYNITMKGDYLHVLLNSGKGLTIKDDGRTKISKGIFEGRALFDISFSPDGEVEYTKIQDNKRNKIFDPYLGENFGNGFMMMNSVANRRRVMILD